MAKQKEKIVRVTLSRVYEYDVTDLEGSTMKDKKDDAYRKTYEDFKNDWIQISANSDDFSAKTKLTNKYKNQNP